MKISYIIKSNLEIEMANLLSICKYWYSIF